MDILKEKRMWQRFKDWIAGGCWHNWEYFQVNSHFPLGLYTGQYRICTRCKKREVPIDTGDTFPEWVSQNDIDRN